ncbi:MAG: hypothetical protein ABFS12_13015 [Bacteroidota bacterium]
MKDFITSLIQFIFYKSFQKSNCINGILLIFVFFSIPLHAETHYIFPSDIINQTKPAARSMNTAGELYRQRYPHLLYASDFEQRNRSISKDNFRIPSFSNNSWQRHTKILYASDVEPDNRFNRQKNKPRRLPFQNQSGQRYPNVLYASDIELNNHLIRQKNKEALYSFQKRQKALRSVPAPLFPLYKRNASKIQSNTIPDIIVPTDYSHLGSHYNNVGLNTRAARQYDVLTSLGIFPEQWD